MSKYTVRYGRVVNLGKFETARIEIEDTFDTENVPDKRDALMLLARQVEGYAHLRNQYPTLFIPGHNLEQPVKLKHKPTFIPRIVSKGVKY
jgi:hypothetical protein